MALKPGTQLGPYQITAQLGAGGMGEVYRATDTKLKRDVAIKVLPDELSSDADRLARFQREAQVLASLNHPHIASIYGLEDSGDAPCLVLELVEGQTLAERLTSGSVAPDSALDIARQVALGLEAAHEKGIVHRDLKPANVKVTPEGTVKVLDFGLAKALAGEPAGTAEDASHSPTLTLAATQAGMILGTAAYMSPEQARGKAVDKRTDVWSFGCVLYELLAGRQAFAGETVSDVISMILQREPDWSALPAGTPPAVRSLLRRCLRKDRNRRLRDIGDARIEIEDALAGDAPRASEDAAPPTTPRSRWGLFGMLVAGAVFGALTASLWWSGVLRAPKPTPNDRAFAEIGDAVQITTTIRSEQYPSLSPDGRTLAYQAPPSDSGDENADIWIHQIGSDQPINRTADHRGEDGFPSWSPDGTRIAFWSDRDGGGVFVMSALTGGPRRVFSDPVPLSGAPAWSSDGTRIAYIVNDPEDPWLGIQSLIDDSLERVDLPVGGIELAWSPDEEWIAYAFGGGYQSATKTLRVLRLASGESSTIAPELFRATWSPRWSEDGRQLFFSSGSYDIWVVETSDGNWSDPRQVTSDVWVESFDLSADGRNVAYTSGVRITNLWRVPVFPDRPARWDDAEQLTFDTATISFASISPDRQTLLFDSTRGQTANRDLWKMPIDGGPIERLTSHPALDWHPVLSPLGDEIAFYSLRSGEKQVWRMPADGGPAEQVTHHGVGCRSPKWSPDGKELAYRCRSDGTVRVLSLETNEERTVGEGDGPAWSPDGQWLALRTADGLMRVPAGGGTAVSVGSLRSVTGQTWSLGGDEIYYCGVDEVGRNALRAVRLADAMERPLVDLNGRPGGLHCWVVATEGTHLYFAWKADLTDIWVTQR